MSVTLALSFGKAGIVNWHAKSLKAALFAARRKRSAMRRGNRATVPMFIHDPDKPAVLQP